MSSQVFQEHAVERIKHIHKTSAEYNKRVKRSHEGRLLELIKHHAEEIQELYDADDKHFIVETGDLAVLCFELILEQNKSVDDVLLKCFDRYDKKLLSLMNET